MKDLYPLLRPLLFCLDAEMAHGLTVKALNSVLGPKIAPPVNPGLRVDAIGLSFPNPLGMAAGFDKNGQAIEPVLRLGFGFAEVGTVTPKPQEGNARPRLFRLEADHAVVNRFGFSNLGHLALRERLLAQQKTNRSGIVGVNIGANKDAKDRVADYVAGIEAFADIASYFTINVSSPNTPGLRDLQSRDALDHLLRNVLLARDDANGITKRRVPVLLKIAPDLDDYGLTDIAEVAVAHGVDGMIVSNTTLSRAGLASPRASETGGMSGRPLFQRATQVLARTRQLVGPDMLIIGVGGIDSPSTAWSKIAAGANLIQVYSGLVYEGPALVGRILDGLAHELKMRGISSIKDAVGIETDRWL